MKILLFTLLLLSFVTGDTKQTTYTQNMDEGIAWEKDLDSAFEKAKAEKKTLMVMVVSDNCRWCQKMKQRTFSDTKVAKKLENYVLAMVNREKKDETDQIPPFKHVPTIFFMTHEKEILDRIQGYFQAEDFLEYLISLEEN